MRFFCGTILLIPFTIGVILILVPFFINTPDEFWFFWFWGIAMFLAVIIAIVFFRKPFYELENSLYQFITQKILSILKIVLKIMPFDFLKKHWKYLAIGLGIIVILFLFLYPMWEEKIKYTLYNRCINNNEIKTEKFKNKVESKKDACFSTGEPDINVRRKCYDEVLKFEKEAKGKNERNCYAIIKDIQVQNRMFKSR